MLLGKDLFMVIEKPTNKFQFYADKTLKYTYMLFYTILFLCGVYSLYKILISLKVMKICLSFNIYY